MSLGIGSEGTIILVSLCQVTSTTPGPRAVARPVSGTHLPRSVLGLRAPGPLWSHIPWVAELRWNLAPSLDDELRQKPRRFWWAGVRLSAVGQGDSTWGHPPHLVGHLWAVHGSQRLSHGEAGGTCLPGMGRNPAAAPQGAGAGGRAGRASWQQRVGVASPQAPAPLKPRGFPICKAQTRTKSKDEQLSLISSPV